MPKSKKPGKAPQTSEITLPRLPEELRQRILSYIEDYKKSKKEKIN